jgi:hypothetical protein
LKPKTDSGLRTGGLRTGGLRTGGLRTGSLISGKAAAEAAATAALKQKTARGVRLVGETGDGQFRVSLSPVKKRKRKEEGEPPPLTRWMSAAYPWPDDPATPLILPGSDFLRRIVGVSATVTGQTAPWTELALRVTPGAGDADSLLTKTTAWSGGASQRVVYQLIPVYAGAGAFSGGPEDVAMGVLPPDLWLMPSDQAELLWPEPAALATATIHGVVVRWENSLS